MVRSRLCLVILCTLVLPGCGVGYFSDRATNPIINANLSKGFTTLSMGAGRRTILVQLEPQEGGPPKICAEPPPDALEAYANAIALAMRGNAAAPVSGQDGASIAAEFSRSFGTSTAPMLYRSQGLQMIRDLQFTLCVMRLNRTIDNAQYMAMLREMIPQAVSLVQSEILVMPKVSERKPETVRAPDLVLPGGKELPKPATP